MTAGDLPSTILLLLPGYLTVRVFFWRSHWRPQSDLELLLWSLGAAFALLLPAATLWQSAWGGPAFWELVAAPSGMPTWMPVGLFLAAPILGLTVGFIEDSGALAWAFGKVGIDLSRREDVWWTLFSHNRWCVAHLTDGTVIFGWPSAFSRDRTGGATELYLTKIAKRSDDGEWEDIEGVDGVWLDAEKIQRLYITDFDAERSTSLEETWSPT